jgi:soluble lytic murein transglycosylase-like protein
MAFNPSIFVTGDTILGAYRGGVQDESGLMALQRDLREADRKFAFDTSADPYRLRSLEETAKQQTLATGFTTRTQDFRVEMERLGLMQGQRDERLGAATEGAQLDNYMMQTTANRLALINSGMQTRTNAAVFAMQGVDAARADQVDAAEWAAAGGDPSQRPARAPYIEQALAQTKVIEDLVAAAVGRGEIDSQMGMNILRNNRMAMQGQQPNAARAEPTNPTAVNPADTSGFMDLRPEDFMVDEDPAPLTNTVTSGDGFRVDLTPRFNVLRAPDITKTDYSGFVPKVTVDMSEASGTSKVSGNLQGLAVEAAQTKISAGELETLYRAMIRQESGGRAGVSGPKTVYGTALGMSQMLPETARQMAARAGVPFDVSLLRGTSRQAQAYQYKLGLEYAKEAWENTNKTAYDIARYYHGGPNRKIWGPKTATHGAKVFGHYKNIIAGTK